MERRVRRVAAAHDHVLERAGSPLLRRRSAWQLQRRRRRCHGERRRRTGHPRIRAAHLPCGLHRLLVDVWRRERLHTKGASGVRMRLREARLHWRPESRPERGAQAATSAAAVDVGGGDGVVLGHPVPSQPERQPDRVAATSVWTHARAERGCSHLPAEAAGRAAASRQRPAYGHARCFLQLQQTAAAAPMRNEERIDSEFQSVTVSISGLNETIAQDVHSSQFIGPIYRSG